MSPELYLTKKEFLDKTEGKLSTSKEVMIHLPERYATENVIVEMEMQMQNVNIPSNMTRNEYCETFWSKPFRCNQVDTEYKLKNFFVREWPDSIRNNMWSY